MPATPDQPAAVAGPMMFGLADPDHVLTGVRLQQEARIPGRLLEFSRSNGSWQLTLPRPPVRRMEYLLELRYPDGGVKVVTDPGNPCQAPGAFGAKSVLEFPGYQAPAWLTAAADPGDRAAFDLPAPDGVIGVRTWAQAGAPDDEPLPLLVVHDGPEYDLLASLTQYLGAGVRGGWLPRLRAALLSPGPRTSWYSASPRYARTLTGRVLPALAGLPARSGSAWAPAWARWRCCMPAARTLLRSAACSCSPAVSSPPPPTARNGGSRTTGASSRLPPGCTTAGCRMCRCRSR